MSLISLWWYNIIGYQRAINWFKSLIPSTNNITPEFRTLNNTLPLVVVAVKLFGAPRVFWSRTPLLGKTGFFGTFYVMNDHLVWAQTCAVDIFNVIYIYIIYRYIWIFTLYMRYTDIPLQMYTPFTSNLESITSSANWSEFCASTSPSCAISSGDVEGLKVDNFGTLPTVSTAPLKTPAPR